MEMGSGSTMEMGNNYKLEINNNNEKKSRAKFVAGGIIR